MTYTVEFDDTSFVFISAEGIRDEFSLVGNNLLRISRNNGGMVIDPTDNYKKDANGNYLLDDNGEKIVKWRYLEESPELAPTVNGGIIIDDPETEEGLFDYIRAQHPDAPGVYTGHESPYSDNVLTFNELRRIYGLPIII